MSCVPGAVNSGNSMKQEAYDLSCANHLLTCHFDMSAERAPTDAIFIPFIHRSRVY